ASTTSVNPLSLHDALPISGEKPLAAAQREFEEETGCRAQGPFIPLTPITQRSGKVVHAWAVEGDCDPAHLHSNLFSLEWPPKSRSEEHTSELQSRFDLVCR